MKKMLLLLACMLFVVPVMAEDTTNATAASETAAQTSTQTTIEITKQFTPFTDAINRAKLQQEADKKVYEEKRIENQKALEAKKEEIQNKIETKKEEYQTKQEEHAKMVEEQKKQNEAKKEEFKNSVETSKKGVQTLRNQLREDANTTRANVAKDYTNLKKSVIGQ